MGRWPWPRAVLADAVEALDRLGARVIALDLLLVDPQEPQYLPDGTRVDHDARLADALAKVGARTVLAASVDEAGTRLSGLWTSAEGRRQWDALRAALREDITRDSAAVAAAADLDGVRAARVHGRLLQIKQVVAHEAAAELRRGGEPLTLEALRAELLPPEKNRRLGEFPALNVLRGALERETAIAAVEARLPDAVPGHAYEAVDAVVPPLPRFAEAVDAVGVVNAQQDSDGRLRRVVLRWRGHGRVYPQFGLAAVAAWRGDPPSALAAPELRLDGFAPAGEEMLLSWPRIDPDSPILGLFPHLSLGRVLAWVRAERALAAQEERWDTITRVLVDAYLFDEFSPDDVGDPAQRAAIEAELHREAADRLKEAGTEETDEDFAWRAWHNLTMELARGRRELVLAERELRQALHDRLVFVGWYATGNFGDFYTTALHERTPGVVAHAVVANGVLTGYAVTQARAWLGALATLVLGAGAALLTASTGPRLGFLLALLLAVLYFAGHTLLSFARADLFVAAATPLFGLFAAWAGTVVMRALKVMREKAALRRQFGARISKQLFEFLVENPETVHLEGEEKEVTCFFSDLAGFTSISEKLDSRATVALLNRYMYAMNEELVRLSAYVNKFLGDGIMAVWGAFTSGTPHAARACQAALACLERLDALNAQPELAGLPKLSMRVGIATGVVTVGDCGAPPDLRDYTVIGDTVNLAARLESANKQFGTRILVNGRTRALLGPDLSTRPLGRIAVVGQQQATEVHELVARRGEETPEQRDLIERTARAVERFAAGDLAAAEEAWRAIVAAHGPSPLAALYLEQIEELAARPAAPDFDGVVRLTSK